MDHVATPAHEAAAMEGTAQGLVLIKNRNNTLPLKAGAKIAIIGPLAVYPQAMMGDYYAGG